MWVRLLKEFRGIRWEVLLGAIFCGETAFQQSQISLFWLLLFVTYMVTRLFAGEYSLQTMDMLLTQPISRRRLWYEKLLVLTGSGLILVLAMLFALILNQLMQLEEANMPLSLLGEYLGQPMWAEKTMEVFVLGSSLLICVTCGCLFFSVWMKNTLAAFGFTFITVFMLLALTVQIAEKALVWRTDDANIILAPEAMLFIFVPFAIYSGISYLLACRLFQRFESTGNTQKSLDLVNLLAVPLRYIGRIGLITNPVTRGAKHLGVNRLSMWGQLFFKELGLHQVSWLLFGLCVVVFICGAVFFNPNNPEKNIGKLMFWGSLFMSGIMLPLTVGAVTVAEERNLGLLECQLVQPASRLHQWIIKIAAAYVIVLIVAIGFPRLGIWAGINIFNIPLTDQRYFSPGVIFLISGIVGLGLTTLAIYASSLCRTPVRALLAAIAFFAIAYATIPMMMNYILAFTVSTVFDIVFYYLEWLFPNESQTIILQANDLLHNIVPYQILVIGMGILALISIVTLTVAYTNYRRQQITWFWQAIQCVIVILAIQFYIFLVPTQAILEYWNVFPL